MIIPIGGLLWLGCARLAFPRTPMKHLVLFTLVSELISGAIDLWAWDEVSKISFC